MKRLEEIKVVEQQSLKKFITYSDRSLITSSDWKRFYEFVVDSYHLNEYERYSISQLNQILRDHGFVNHSKLSVLYAHGLYMIAISKNNKIYGEYFNP